MYDIKQNISLASLDKISNKFILNENQEVMEAERFREKMKIKKTPSIYQKNRKLKRWESTEGCTKQVDFSPNRIFLIFG
ncbi:hypothetical protein GCM10020331_099640 [Ectobacillus funiculus]